MMLFLSDKERAMSLATPKLVTFIASWWLSVKPNSLAATFIPSSVRAYPKAFALAIV